MNRFTRALLTAGIISTAVSACGGRDFSDLDAFMAEKRARPGGIIAPIPTCSEPDETSRGGAGARFPRHPADLS